MSARAFPFFFPVYLFACTACGKGLAKGEGVLCTRCLRSLPRDRDSHLEIELLFAGECRIDPLFALFQHHRASRHRRLVHAVKYRDREQLGVYLGKMIGERIAGRVAAEMIVPVPLHPARQRARGFNQAARLARGIAEVLHLPTREEVIRRVIDNPSQTGLNPGERMANVERVFAVTDREALEGKHLLLVDDVITTGATIASCLHELGSIPGIRVSVACLSRALVS
ncbi:MAG: ComF family protein [Odoribacteraceae bacterium]|jgi:ComF family protein|nr:ComF family protein [Odoribacteraceae bacterium]